MQNDWASENLRVIRTLMESSAVYRRALAPVMGAVGVTGIVAGVAGVALNFRSSRVFVVYWTAVALVCLVEAFLMMRRQALRDLEPFWSPPTRRVAQAISPAFLLGLVAASAVFMLDTRQRQSAQAVLLLVPAWMLLYGLGLHAAGFFMPRRFKMFGWGYILCGLEISGYLLCGTKSTGRAGASLWLRDHGGGVRRRSCGLRALSLFHGEARESFVNTKPFFQIDRVIHEKGRLPIMSLLAASPELSFIELRETLKMTDGNLRHAYQDAAGGGVGVGDEVV